jgi:hypothetical protein
MYTTTLYVMVDKVKGVGRVPPTLTTQADFSIMMECTPESGSCHSVYSVVPSTTNNLPKKVLKYTVEEI